MNCRTLGRNNKSQMQNSKYETNLNREKLMPQKISPIQYWYLVFVSYFEF